MTPGNQNLRWAEGTPQPQGYQDAADARERHGGCRTGDGGQRAGERRGQSLPRHHPGPAQREALTAQVRGHRVEEGPLRPDLVAKETAEIAVLQAYLPAQLESAELDALIAEAIAASSATSIKDMGKVMALVKPKVQGRADMGAVSARIKQKLG